MKLVKHPHYTIEDANPRGRSVKDMEMSIRRARLLSDLCEVSLTLCHNDPMIARDTPPGSWGSIPLNSKQGKRLKANPGTLLSDIWGEDWRHHTEYKEWEALFDGWWDGSLKRQVDGVLAALPLSVRSKLE